MGYGREHFLKLYVEKKCKYIYLHSHLLPQTYDLCLVTVGRDDSERHDAHLSRPEPRQAIRYGGNMLEPAMLDPVELIRIAKVSVNIFLVI